MKILMINLIRIQMSLRNLKATILKSHKNTYTENKSNTQNFPSNISFALRGFVINSSIVPLETSSENSH